METGARVRDGRGEKSGGGAMGGDAGLGTEERGRAVEEAVAPAAGRPRHAMPRFPAFEVSRDFASFAAGDSRFADYRAARDGARDESPSAGPAPAVPQAGGAAPDGEADAAQARVDAILTLVGGQGGLREVLYKALDRFRERMPFGEAEAFLASLPEYEFGHPLQTPYSCIDMLAKAGGLELTPVDAGGRPIDPALLASLGPDEADDLVEGRLVQTTPAGAAAADLLAPARRLAALLAARPHRQGTFLRVLGFCAEAPRSLDDIRRLFEEEDGLVLDMVDAHTRLSPDYYADRLEKAGGLVWRGAWEATPAGRDFLESRGSRPGSR